METELKLTVANARAWSGVLNAPLLQEYAGGQPPRRVDMEAIYFDTPDHRLQQARIGYRVRREDAQLIATVKADSATLGGLHQRPEWNAVVSSIEPDISVFADTEIHAALIEAIGDQMLVPVVSTRFERHLLDLKLPDGSEVEFAADRGEIRAGTLEAPILELELELKAGQTLGVLQLAARLAEDFPLLLEERSKLHRGLILAGLTPDEASPPPPVNVPPGETVGASFSRVLLQGLFAVLSAQAAFLKDPDEPETLHRLRVSLRRLRALLGFARPLVADASYTGQQEALRNWGNELGNLRETDVLISTWARILESGALPFDPPPLETVLKQRRVQLQSRICKQLGSGAHTATALRLWIWLLEGHWSAEIDRDLSSYSVERLTGWIESLRRKGKAIEELESGRSHKLRIRVKKLRYALEVLHPLLPGEESGDLHKALKRLQDSLGQRQDTRTSAIYLRELLGPRASRAAHEGMGLLLGWEARESTLLPKTLKKDWKRFKKASRYWLAAL
ncbi:CYTH and CHAD domain-containing protein [Thermithiobacillus plumbiphilus]|uniref:CYTH and CHAD domain-containing protein n=1 Tax=Thermithiobacillus plumbiphilus TaxID=1729899 RepID=A0ABU9D6X9_9PROT